MECKFYKSLDELPNYYQSLFDHNFDDNFYSSANWFETLTRTTKKANEELLILGAEKNNKALGILFMVQSNLKIGPFTLKKLSSLTNIYSVTFSPMLDCREKSEVEIIYGIVNALTSLSNKWDIIEFNNIEKTLPIFESFHKLLNEAKYITQTSFCHRNWFEHTKNENFDTYLSKRKSKVKGNHRRRLKKAEGELGTPKFNLFSNFDNLDYAIREFKKVYALSWKGEERHPKFIEEIIKTAAEKNILRLGLYSVNDVTLAAKLTFATKTTGHMYKTAYDPKYKKYGTGTAINMFMIEHLLNVDKVNLLDFGLGDESYKSELMNSSRERWRITAYNSKSLYGLFCGTYYTIGRIIKNNLIGFKKNFAHKTLNTPKPKKYGLQSIDSVTNLPTNIKKILSNLDKSAFFISYGWFDLLEKYALPKNHTVKIFILQDSFNNQPLLIYPLLIKKSTTLRGTITTLSDFSTIYGIKFSPIFLNPDLKENDLLNFFFAKLKTGTEWDVLNIGLLHDGPEKSNTIFQTHLSACKKNFLLADKYYHSLNWQAHIKNNDFDSYLYERPRKLQNTLRRKDKKLHNETISEIIIYKNLENIDKAINDYQEIYQSSWKDAEYSPDFIHNFIRTTARLNILRLGILYIDGKPAAFVKMLLCDNKAIIYKLAYAPEYNIFSPGSILLRDMIKHVIENDSVDFIDFGIGNDPYKKDWMHIKSHVYGIIVFNWKTLSGLSNAAKHFIGKLLKKNKSHEE